MALYLGDSGKLIIKLNNVTYRLNVYADHPVIKGIVLLSSDGYMLKDSAGVYLTSKESDE